MNAPSLYSITGDIKDINTLLVPRSELEAAKKDAGRQPVAVFINLNEGATDALTGQPMRPSWHHIHDNDWDAKWTRYWLVPAIDAEMAKGDAV